MPIGTAEVGSQISAPRFGQFSESVSALSGIFRTSLSLFGADDWTSDSNLHCPGDEPCAIDLEDRQNLDELLESGRTSMIRSLPDGRFRLFFRVGEDGTKPVVATGVIAGGVPELIESLAQASQCIVRYQNSIEQQQAGLDAFAEQVSLDFEELTWLRGLAEQLEYCAVSNPVDRVSAQVLPSLREIVGAEALVLFLAKETGESDGKLPSPLDSSAIRAGSAALGDELCRQLIEQLNPTGTASTTVKNHMYLSPEFAHFCGIHSCILAPVAHGGFRVGWLLALNRIQDQPFSTVRAAGSSVQSWEYEFGTVEASLISAAAAMLCTHARNAALFREKEALLVGVIRSLINAMDAKDSYTCGHSDRVALIARRLGEELGLDHQECERLYMTGLLHDIGKIGVPDDVLMKPGKLTEAEFAKIKRHPEIGHSILKHLPHLSYALPGVLYHHESVSGTGYPHALAADQIPLFGRILAVADAYDAMTSDRPYRAAMPTEKAEAILLDGSGKQWDGMVVQALVSAHCDIRKICEESREHTQSILHPASPSHEDPRGGQRDSVAVAISVTSN